MFLFIVNIIHLPLDGLVELLFENMWIFVLLKILDSGLFYTTCVLKNEKFEMTPLRSTTVVVSRVKNALGVWGISSEPQCKRRPSVCWKRDDLLGRIMRVFVSIDLYRNKPSSPYLLQQLKRVRVRRVAPVRFAAAAEKQTKTRTRAGQH